MSPTRASPSGNPDRQPINLVEEVRDALAHLHDPVWLETRPLARRIPRATLLTSISPGKALGAALLAAIESLRPDPKVSSEALAQRSYQLLTLRYVEALEVPAIVARLAISRSQLFRDEGKAIEAVAAIIGNRYGIAAADEPASMSASDPIAPLSPSTPLSNLPFRLTSFVGRERDLTELTRLLDGTRLVTLVGPGGVGKTRLAEELGRARLTDYPDGIWFVDLAPLADAARLPHAVALTLGVQDRLGQPIRATLLSFLKNKHLLLVLDNCEHLIVDCALLARDLLESCPNLRILATSRELLHADGEIVWAVSSLALPPGGWRGAGPEAAAAIAPAEAVRLFVDRAQAVAADFSLTEANAWDVAEICRRLDGIPFAIELAARRVRILSAAQIADRLDDRFNLLAAGSRMALPRHQTLRALIDWSYDLMTVPEQTLLGRLAVFAGGFDLKAAEAVGEGIGCQAMASAPSVLVMLGELVDKSLVVAETPPSGAEVRYRLLATIPEFAREHLEASGEAEETARRHAAHYSDRAEEAAKSNYSPRQWLVRAHFAPEQDNLRAAMDWWVEHDAVGAARLAVTLGEFWLAWGVLAEGSQRYNALVQLRDGLPRSLLARLLFCAALFSIDRAVRRAWWEQSLALSREIGDHATAGGALYRLGELATTEGDYSSARALFAQCIAASPGLRPLALGSLGEIARRSGDYPRARAQLEEAVGLTRQSGVLLRLGAALNDLAKLERAQGNFARAMSLTEEALALHEQEGHRALTPWVLRAVGRLARLQGDHGKARVLLSDTLADARQLGVDNLTAEILDDLGLLAAAQGDFSTARPYLKQALSLMCDHPERRWAGRWQVAEITASLGLVARAEGNLREARRLFDETLSIWREFANPHGVAIVQGNLGVVALQEGDLAGARGLFAESLLVRRELGDKGGIAMLLECFAGLASLADESWRAFQLLGAADVIREAIGNPAPPVWRRQRDPWIEPARQALDDAFRLQAYVTGQTMGLDHAIEDTLGIVR